MGWSVSNVELLLFSGVFCAENDPARLFCCGEVFVPSSVFIASVCCVFDCDGE